MLQSYTCTIHTYTKINLSTVKWAQWDKTQSRELLGLFICVCIALCTIIVAHNIAQNRPDNFPSYPPDDHLFLELLQVGNLGRAIESPDENLSGETKQIVGCPSCCQIDTVKARRGTETLSTMNRKNDPLALSFLSPQLTILLLTACTTVLRFTRRLKVTA